LSTDVFQLAGSYQCTPCSGVPSGDPLIQAALSEQAFLSAKQVDTVTLPDTTPKAVSFGDLAQADVIVLRALGGKVSATITSGDGTSQVIPVEPLLILMNDSVAVTAIVLTAASGAPTIAVKVFLGQRQ
jgi:hypothetical protein